MKKISKVAVVIQNNIQYESFKTAMDLMVKNKITVDIFIPQHNVDDGFNVMFDTFFQKIKDSNFNIYREINNKKYDILFLPYSVDPFLNLKRKYTIKYMYSVTTKPEFSLSLETNYIFDGFLCYGDFDAACLSNFGITFKIGNLKYVDFKRKRKRKTDKLTILYLPTYAEYSSIEIIGPELKKLEKYYNIIIKPHHGTEYLKNEIEQNRMKFLRNNFQNIYSSTDSLLDLLNECDVVITDQSGAVFDAICTKKPVLMYYNENELLKKNIALPIRYAKQNYFVSFTKLENDLNKYVKQACTSKQLAKQNKLFNILFCKSEHVKENFLRFLNDLENNIIDENYYENHQLLKEKIFIMFNKIDSFNYKIDSLNCEITKLENKSQEYSKEIFIKSKNLDKITKQYNVLEKEYLTFKNNIYNSTSWKITKPLRAIKNFIQKSKH